MNLKNSFFTLKTETLKTLVYAVIMGIIYYLLYSQIRLILLPVSIVIGEIVNFLIRPPFYPTSGIKLFIANILSNILITLFNAFLAGVFPSILFLSRLKESALRFVSITTFIFLNYFRIIPKLEWASTTLPLDLYVSYIIAPLIASLGFFFSMILLTKVIQKIERKKYGQVEE